MERQRLILGGALGAVLVNRVLLPAFGGSADIQPAATKDTTILARC